MPPFSLCSFPKLHVSMCYNHAGKQKKNWLMRGAVAILPHKAWPQNIPWLWRGKVQTCFSWQWEVYSLSWSSFATQTSGLVTHEGLRFSVLWDMSWPLITRSSMEQQFCRSHGKIQVYTVGPLSSNLWGSDEISNQWKTDKRRSGFDFRWIFTSRR